MRGRHLNYRLLRRRFRRTLGYGEHRKIDQLSAPLTGSIDEFQMDAVICNIIVFWG